MSKVKKPHRGRKEKKKKTEVIVMLPRTNVNKSPKAKMSANSTKSHKLANIGNLAGIECLSRNHLKVKDVTECSLGLFPAASSHLWGPLRHTRPHVKRSCVWSSSHDECNHARDKDCVVTKQKTFFFFAPWPMFYLSIKSFSQRTEFPPEWLTVWLPRISLASDAARWFVTARFSTGTCSQS